ncbi:hypothetical protein [Inquilinus sp. Marseille-Q2685]|uniref:hypothetical protein n=1 Tax=Inquilinus sp. Marseille-Q2685 TaxID=2866581 RepID=UPI001CE4863C|nr:hypothetical protein [Inquilinus sp. Marseille-Q2685]
MIGRASTCGLLILMALAGLASLAVAAPPPSSDCRIYSYSDQRDLLVRKLKRDGYSAKQSKFLMWLSDLKARSIKETCLTDEGRQCGAGSIKGMMLECTRKFLDEAVAKAGMTPTSPGLDEIKPMALYGRTEFAVRAILALSAMEACSGGAKERFFRLPQQGDCLMDMDATPP